MSSIGIRIKELRKEHNMTQSDLANLIKMTYVQIGRYEKRGAIPSSEVLLKLSEALNTTTDFLINGNQNEATSKQLKNKKILGLFKKVEQLNEKDKDMIITFIDALVTKRHIQQLAS